MQGNITQTMNCFLIVQLGKVLESLRESTKHGNLRSEHTVPLRHEEDHSFIQQNKAQNTYLDNHTIPLSSFWRARSTAAS